MKTHHSVYKALIPKIEALFDYCIQEGSKRGFDIDSVLEIPSVRGHTCFQIASSMSEKITKYILDRPIKINSIDMNLMIPEFKFADLSSQMMLRGVNPYVIDYAGISEAENNSFSFDSSESKSLLASFPRSIHYSIEDINCFQDCPVDCPSSQEYKLLAEQYIETKNITHLNLDII